jgi:hypothetical protein
VSGSVAAIPASGGLSIVATAGGGIVALNGADSVIAGIRQLVSGRPAQTLTSYVVESATGSHTAGKIADIGIGLVGPNAASKISEGKTIVGAAKSIANETISGIKSAGAKIKDWWKGTPTVPQNVNKIGDDVTQWLGEGSRKITNEHGDVIFQSQNGLKEIRFDMNNYVPHNKPHIHLIIYEQVKNKKEKIIEQRLFFDI